MKDLFKPENIKLTECGQSDYVKLKRINYTQDGVDKKWDVALVHDSVAIIIYNKTRRCMVLVKQFRPPVYLKNNEGFTYELCAGITDKDKPLEVIAKEEILEETGYDVPVESIKKLTSFYTAVSFAGSVQNLYFVEVEDSQKLSNGGGVGTEKIEVIELKLEDLEDFIWDESKAKTPGILFSFHWAMQQKFYKEYVSGAE